MDTQSGGKSEFEQALTVLKADVTAAAAMATNDGRVRTLYSATLDRFARDLREKAATNQITWKEAAHQAHEMRNTCMEVMRGRTSPIGRSFAREMKAKGLGLNDLLTKYTTTLYGDGAAFETLSNAQKERVYARIVERAGASKASVNRLMRMASRAGRGVIVLSVATSVYVVATSDDPARAAGQEVSVTAAGIGGGVIGGATAGLICGPGAPVCVTIGAFVGGTLAALGMDLLW